MESLLRLSTVKEQQQMKQSINACAAESQKMNTTKDKADFEKDVSNASKALTGAVSILKALNSGRADEGLSVAMGLFSSIAALAGGPLDSDCICGCGSSIISFLCSWSVARKKAYCHKSTKKY